MFDSQTLKKFEYLSLASSKQFAGQSAGERRNAKLGGGVEFADYRNYAFGDDVRNLDWNVYARFETLYIKRFQEEGDIPVYFFLDVSSSMGEDATAAKFDDAKKIVGALGYVSLMRFDSVSVFPFADDVVDAFPLSRGKEKFLPLADYLEALRPRRAETRISNSIQSALKKIVKPGLAVVVSDCFDANGLDDALERLLARRFEPLVLHIYSTEEALPTETGDFELIDAETGEHTKVMIDEATLKLYRKRFDAFLAKTRKSCVRRGARFYSTVIDVPFENFLLEVARDVKVGR